MPNVIILAALPTPWSDPLLSASTAQTLITQPHHHLFAVGPGGQHGHVFARLVPGTAADVLTLYVQPEHRRKGYAKILMENVIFQAEVAGCSGLTLEVRGSNTAAIRLYKQCGLAQIATRANYYSDAVSKTVEDALVFGLNLP
jgi:ribosomal protein S18 acetylase RimI-like enzyme